MPLIHSPTYFPEPGRITGTRSHLDILPTIADLLEVELVEGEFEGTSMLGPVPKDRKLFFRAGLTNSAWLCVMGPSRPSTILISSRWRFTTTRRMNWTSVI